MKTALQVTDLRPRSTLWITLIAQRGVTVNWEIFARIYFGKTYLPSKIIGDFGMNYLHQ